MRTEPVFFSAAAGSYYFLYIITLTVMSFVCVVFESSSGPFEGPEADSKEESRTKQEQRKQQRARSRPHSERKWSRSGRNADRHMADVKIELGPMPFDPKY